ncbi:MAG: xanthine dehydrogenase family protein molybdopterin-binding subunit, partial [Proteobacteria bacterium]|nr:xanthine dehydrogenase family protein molybdopterin-binding subunit [Pseudomonadota bacterium]
VLTGADYAADGLGVINCAVPNLTRRDGSPMYRPSHPAMQPERVRIVGDPVAIIVAETLLQARDAAEMIAVEYDPLPVIADTATAANGESGTLWDDCPENEAFLFTVGDAAATEAGFAKADHVVKQHIVINRVATVSMEPRGCNASYDPLADTYTVYAGVQRTHGLRRDLAENFFHLPEHQFRVHSNDVGGSFGMKGGTYVEYPLTLWASRKIGRPVKWACDRSESFASDEHARDNVTDAELALSRDGDFLALRVKTTVNVGAYLATMGPQPGIGNVGTLAGVYTTPAIHVAVTGAFTNMNPTSPYRGAGRPEAAYVIERLIDTAAREMGIDRVEIRRRNMIPADAMPYQTGLTFKYDSGEFETIMDKALAMADWAGFEARRAEAASRGKLRGIGFSCTIEQAGGRSMQEVAELRFEPSGSATLYIGTVSHGQGHDTIYKQILSEHLGMEMEDIRVVEGDTDRVTFGIGTFGSRSTSMGGSAIVLAAEKIIAKGKRIAAHMLETSESDIEFAAGKFTVAGTDRSVGLREVARSAFMMTALPKDIEPGFSETGTFVPEVSNFPNGTHVCEVEIDPDTGAVSMQRYSVVDDVGTVINPLLLKGQIYGGIAQGVGQILKEDIAYDPQSGQLLTGSFMDYAMPRADDFCDFAVESHPVPTPTNPLGAKGAGEAGTVGAMPATMNAIIDALSPLGVTYLDLPATPERIWRAIRDARG